MNDTICWHCNAAYPIDEPVCPECHAANANVDLERAQAEMLDASLINKQAEEV